MTASQPRLSHSGQATNDLIADILKPVYNHGMRLFAAVLLSSLMPVCTNAADAEDRLMAKIEKQIRLPRGAANITTYRRHYAWSDKRDTVYAVYERGGRPARLWLLLEEMPIILDGGCNVVTFDYDVVRDRPLNVTCN